MELVKLGNALQKGSENLENLDSYLAWIILPPKNMKFGETNLMLIVKQDVIFSHLKHA